LIIGPSIIGWLPTPDRRLPGPIPSSLADLAILWRRIVARSFGFATFGQVDDV
jgi:hypothetical protein